MKKLKKGKHPGLWDRNNPLDFYVNAEKLDELIMRAWGEIVTQVQSSNKKSGNINAKLTAKFGSLLSMLGLAEGGAEIGGEIGTEEVNTKIVSITYASKLRAFNDYLEQNYTSIPHINVLDGTNLIRDRKRLLPDWDAVPLSESDKTSSIGFILGLFTPTRVSPPHNKAANLGNEILELTGGNNKSNLWTFVSIEESEIGAQIPIITGNIRLASQTTVLYCLMESEFKVEALGLLDWKDDHVLMCDPMSLRIFM